MPGKQVDAVQNFLDLLDQAAIQNTGKGLKDHVSNIAGGIVDAVMKNKPPKTRRKVNRSDELTNAFRTLGLDPAADFDMVDGAYKFLAKKYHPDNKKTGDEDKMKAINEAKDFIDNTIARKKDGGR